MCLRTPDFAQNSVHIKPSRRYEESKKAETDIFRAIFPDLPEPVRKQCSEGHDDFQQGTTIPETPCFLEALQELRLGTGRLHERLMKLAREKQGAV